jgi:cell division protein DivIC
LDYAAAAAKRTPKRGGADFEICFTRPAGVPFLAPVPAVNSRRLLAGLYLLLFLGLSLGAGTLYLKLRQGYDRQRRAQEALRQDVADLRAKIAAQEKYLERLRTDPVLVERLLRERLKYSRPNEWVFDFVE